MSIYIDIVTVQNILFSKLSEILKFNGHTFYYELTDGHTGYGKFCGLLQ